jgi:hypothetical protein
MFRAETVINAALMLAIYSEYRQIFLMGTEADWIKNLRVDKDNHLWLNDTHFYKENERVILPDKMHNQCLSLYYAFRTYTDIEHYSKHCKVKIYNLTPSSFIDAFEKTPLLKQ